MFQRKQTQLLALAALVLLAATLACGGSVSPTLVGQVTTEPSREGQTAVPTYTPYPTYTPLPTHTPFPTYTPVSSVFPVTSSVDLAHNTEFAEALNAYRVQNGQVPLNISYHLAYVAASRVQITMIPGIDMGIAQIDPKVMPQNYAWVEYTFGGDTAFALSINTPEAALQHLSGRDGFLANLQDPRYRDIGAALLCNGQRCGYVVILGRPYP